ncbi:hypothetical protein ACFV23_46075 [Streptomyces sp. NPDC059627]
MKAQAAAGTGTDLLAEATDAKAPPHPGVNPICAESQDWPEPTPPGTSRPSAPWASRRFTAARTAGRVLAMNILLIVDPQAKPGPYLDHETWGIPLGHRETDAHFVLRARAAANSSSTSVTTCPT